jgi:ribosomal protein L11 methyltransferase
LQLGLGPVEAFDTEAEAVRVARENADANGVTGLIEVREGTLPARGAGPYGLIIANIFLTVLEELLPRLDRALAQEGSLLVAGITDSQEDRMLEALLARGIRVVDRICEGAQRGARRWPVLLARKP